MKKMCFRILVVVLLTVFILSGTAAAQLVWLTSKQAAVELALQQNKGILLLAGRDT